MCSVVYDIFYILLENILLWPVGIIRFV